MHAYVAGDLGRRAMHEKYFEKESILNMTVRLTTRKYNGHFERSSIG
jgi:hypothetical protein